MTKMKALSLALVGIFLSTAYVAAAEGDSSPAPATASADPSAPGSVADPAGSPVESSVRTLTEQEDALIEQISQLDRSDPDYQNQLKAIGAELRRIQEELQWSNHSFGGPYGHSAGPSVVGSEGAPFSPYDGMDAASLRQSRDELNAQLKYLDRTLDSLGPQDEPLAASLREQRQLLTDQIEELDTRIGAVPAGATSTVPAADPTGSDFDTLFGGGQAPAGPSLSGRPQPIVDRPAATSPLSPASPGSPTDVPSGSAFDVSGYSADPTAVDGAWYSSDNKNQRILDAIEELRKSNDEVRQQLAEVMDELKMIETQLKLLSRQAVADR
jgi:prefoldin subunit 5